MVLSLCAYDASFLFLSELKQKMQRSRRCVGLWRQIRTHANLRKLKIHVHLDILIISSWVIASYLRLLSCLRLELFQYANLKRVFETEYIYIYIDINSGRILILAFLNVNCNTCYDSHTIANCNYRYEIVAEKNKFEHFYWYF